MSITDKILTGLAVLSFLLLIIYAFISLTKSINKTFRKLDGIKAMAEQASTLEEVESISLILDEVSKECWHKSFAPKLYEILGILKGKQQIFSKNNTT